MSMELAGGDPWTGAEWPESDNGGGTLPLNGNRAKELPAPPRLDLPTMFWHYIAAGAPNTPPSVLAILAQDDNAHIRRRVAENPSTSVKTLDKLSNDQFEHVRIGVAKNRRTPVHVLRKLAADESIDVRFQIAGNPEVPDAILLSMFMDPDPYVADRASQTLAA